MIKFILSLMLFTSQSPAGTFIERSFYVETDLLVGFGTARAEAIADALQALPQGYKLNTNFSSPAIQCMGNHVWSEEKECGSERVQYSLPVRKTNEAQPTRGAE